MQLDWRLLVKDRMGVEHQGLQFECVRWLKHVGGIEVECEFDDPDAFAVAVGGALTCVVSNAEADSFVVGHTYRTEFA